jgi:pyridoxamine 5'-phosphate oxidase
MQDPFERFQEWLAEAKAAGEPEPTAMSLATATAAGAPRVRMVLLKHADERGFVFYTNLGSPKALELEDNPAAALCFFWPLTKRQVRVDGRVTPVSDAEADAYFATRPRLSQIGAWASRQSHRMAHRLELEQAVAAVTLRYGIGAIPRPPFWSGFRVAATRMEFWSGMAFRLHDRVRYVRDGDSWRTERLFP